MIESYEILPTAVEGIAAQAVPWVELFLGLFLITGLWLKWSLRAVIVLFMMFLTIVGQAMIRHLPIEECGCFGGLLSVPLIVVFCFDSTLLALSVAALTRLDKTGSFSVDARFK